MLRTWLRTPRRRGLAAGIALTALAAGALALRSYFGQSPAAAASSQRTFICAQTRKPFEYTLRAGDVLPVRSPHTGRNTGYPAELCGWRADGRIADRPTPVLLNSYLGRDEPTFCPACGRLVVGHNPPAVPGRKPPPRQEEYRATDGDMEPR